MKKTSVLLILILLLFSCKEKPQENPIENNMTNIFISRLHTPDLETDYHKILGTTTLEKHTSDFEKIDWSQDFWSEFNSGNFNMSDLEVLSVNDAKYLTIMTGPDTGDTFQFIIGLGTHLESDNKNEPNRKVKLYLTESEDTTIPRKFIYLFFKREFDQINKELSKLTFMEEVDDLYLNKI